MTNVPKIRFPGFTEPWEQRKLRDISSLITKGTTPLDKSGEGDVNFVKVENLDADSGEILSTAKISRREHEGYLKRSQLKENDILFSIAGTLGRVGIVKSSILPANTNQALAIIRTKNGDLNYLATILRGKAVRDFIKRNPTIGAQPNLSLEQVGNLEIPFPSIDEQKIIGAYFKNLDNLITLHQHKLDDLQELKKGLLQKMFPADGSNVPELRFPGFTTPWEQRKLKDISEKLCVGFVGTCEKYYTDANNGVPMYRTGNIKDGNLTNDDLKYVTKEFHEANKKSQLKKGDILIARFGDNGLGAIYKGTGQANCLNCILLHPFSSEASSEFVQQFLASDAARDQVSKEIVGSTFGILNTTNLGNLYLSLPSKQEQYKISAFLCELDNLITLHQRKLDDLKELKKGLLQQMFVE